MYHGTCALCGSKQGYALKLYPSIIICTWCYMRVCDMHLPNAIDRVVE
jgi:hypothetical protein